MSNQSNVIPYVIEAQPPPKKVVTVLNGGANRGARENLRAFADFNRISARAEIVPVYSDPAPGRALAMKEEAEKQGITARAIEGRVEDLAVADASADPVILNLDRASAIASVLRSEGSAARPVLGYLLMRLPSGRLRAVRFVLEAHDRIGRQVAIAFFERLAEVSERNTSDAILGPSGDPAHSLMEPAIRQWFAVHTRVNLGKIAAGIEPATNSFEVTTNGSDTFPLLIAVAREWSDPLALAERVVANPSTPIRKGMAFFVAEVTPEGVRLHEVRRRTDDRVSVGGVEVIDRAAVERAAEEATHREELARQTSQALARAERETLSRRNPIWTTD